MFKKFYRRVMWSTCSLVLCLSLLLSSFVLPVKNAMAGTISDIAEQLEGVYYWLGEDTQGMDAVKDAKTDLDSIDQNEIKDILWPQGEKIVLPLDGVKERLSCDEEEAKNKVAKLLVDVLGITLSGSVADTVEAIYDNYEEDREIVADLLPGISLEKLYGFFNYAQLYGIKETAPLEWESIFTEKDYNEIRNLIKEWLSAALKYASEKGGSDCAAVYDAITGIGWTTDGLAEAEYKILSEVDPGLQAEIALLKAYVRSKAHFSGATGTDGYMETISYKEGSSASGTISVLGKNFNTPLKCSSDNSDIKLSYTDGTLTISGGSAGSTANITLYYDDKDTNWIYKAKATVTSTGGGGGGGGTTPTTGTTEEAEQAADEAEETVNNPDATDEQVAESTSNAASSLDEAAGTVETSEQAEQVAATAAEVTEVLEKAAERVQDPEAAAKVGEAAATAVSAMAKVVEKVAAPEIKKTIEEAATKALDTAAKAVDKMEASKAAEVAEKTVQSAASLAKKLEAGAAKKIAEKTLKVVEKAVEKAGTDKISESEIEVAGEKASVQADLNRLQEKARAAVQAAKEMAEKLKENGLDVKKKLETKVAVEVPATGKELVETKLPPGVLDNLRESGVDRLEVKTEVASISVAPDAFGAEAAGKDIALSAKRVKAEEIPADARRHIPENSVVVDLGASVGNSKVSRFNKPVEVGIPYQLQAGENPDEVTVFLLRDDGTVQPVGGKYDPVSGRAVFKIDHFSKYFAKTARKSFTDLAQCEWARDNVEIMAGKGIIAGRTAAEFDPGADITRAEFSALAVRMLGLSAAEGEDLPFKDVPGDAWYRQVVKAAYDNGIVYGKAADVFDPNGKITRQEMAVIIARILAGEGYEPGSAGDLAGFSDKGQIAGWAQNGCGLASREGIIIGMGDGRFAPDEKATRAQAAVMLYRLFGKLYE